MKYTLCLLTMPGREETRERTLRSFEAHVHPRPAQALAYLDGPGVPPAPLYNGTLPWQAVAGRRSGGFCKATRALWTHARLNARHDWVFWLEDDFDFVRVVNLDDLARVLILEPQVQQMALMRQPCSLEEERAGGYVNVHPERYTRRGGGVAAWWEHRNHWTTNPSLFRASLLAEHSWRAEKECEGRFGFRVREMRPAVTFGIWGAGDPWIRHHGVRVGSGY